MAVPRVFISSTYYDLKFVRNDIGDFIKSLGYEPVMHDKGEVTYSQLQPLEQSCYDELSTCDIVICIIGNKFGTQSSGSNYSITMEELLNAVKQKKKIYIFILNEVFIENDIFLANKSTEEFKTKYTDNIKIHQFISEIKQNIKNHPILPFNNVSEIIETLKKQFAGLFQHLLVQESAITESKTLYDLDNISKQINESLSTLKQEKNEFFKKFNSSYLNNNRALLFLKLKLGMKESAFFTDSKDGLEEFLYLLGFDKKDDLPFPPYEYTRTKDNIITTVIFEKDLFDSDNKLKIIYNMSDVKKYITWEEEEVSPYNFASMSDDDDGLPF